MDLRYSEADEKFRAELRAWLKQEVPAHGKAPSIHDWPGRREYDTGWQRKLFEAGYAGVNWPKEYGGRDATLTEQLVYYEEIARAHAPYVGVNFVGMLHGGPTVIAEGHGTAEGLAYSAHPAWARRSGARGSRSPAPVPIWPTCRRARCATATSTASAATRSGRLSPRFRTTASCWCAPTPTHRSTSGISWLIMPMDLPGIEIRPLPTLMGEGEFSEVFLENVPVPVENRVGRRTTAGA